MLALASLVSAYNSFFLIPLVPITLELACETAYPVGEGTAVGLLFAMGNFSGFLMGTILSVIVQGESKGQSAGGLGFCFAMFLVGMALVYFMKEKLNRSDSEKRTSESRKSGSDSGDKQMVEGPKTELKEQNLVTVKLKNPDDYAVL